MTSNDLSEKLLKLGVKYSPSACRKAWAQGAPKTCASAFAGWLAIHSKINTGASTAAAAAVGISRDATGDLVVSNPLQNAAVIVELLRRRGFDLWICSAPLFWGMLHASARKSDGPTVGEVCGAEFSKAVAEVVLGLTNLFEIAPAVGKRLEDAGYTGDADPWLALAMSDGGPDRLHEMARQAYQKFAALPEE